MNVNKVTCTFSRYFTFIKNVIRVQSLIPSTFTSLNRRSVHLSLPNYASHFKARDRPDLLRTVRKPDDGIQDDRGSLNASIIKKEDMFPDAKTPLTLFNGVTFNQVPICNVCVSKNNAKFRINDAYNKLIIYRSNGMEGFKKCRRGTNVAAQSTAFTVGNKALAKGVKDVRLKIRGIGPGRMAAVKGLQLSGLNIISITDDTRISWRPTARPRKARRL